MVNTGKPSKGCYMCRSRRIKCDEARPHCMRCQKSKRTCPGYRDAFELNHRDETKLAKRRVPQVQEKCGPVFGDSTLQYSTATSVPVHTVRPVWMYSSPSVSSVGNPIEGQVQQRFTKGTTTPGQNSQVSMVAHLSTPLDQQASCFFLSNFVSLPLHGSMTRYLDFLIPLLKTAEPNSPMDLTFSAVALAAFGSQPKSKDVLPRAERTYVRALKAINQALKDPEKALDDATLASVLLLSTFELVASRQTVTGWICHIDGAIALIKARGKSQFRTQVGRDLFISVRAHMTIQCIANSRPIPVDVDWWMNQVEEDDVNKVFSMLNLKVAELRAAAEQTVTLIARTASNTEKVLNLLRCSEALEQEYLDWQKSLPPKWQTKTVAWIDSAVGDITESVVHPGRVDFYAELWMAFMTNLYRSSRLFIWTTILRCVAWLGEPQDYRLTPEYSIASRVCGQLIEDIVASMPYFFGWNGNGTLPMASMEINFACGINEKSSSIKGVSGVFVMWPIYAAKNSDFATPSQRLFLEGRLRAIHQNTGMSQANLLLKATVPHPSTYIQRERTKLNKQGAYSPIRNITRKKSDDMYPLLDSYRVLELSPSPTATPSSAADSVPRSIEDNGGAHDLGYLNDYADDPNLNLDTDYEFSSFVTV